MSINFFTDGPKRGILFLQLKWSHFEPIIYQYVCHLPAKIAFCPLKFHNMKWYSMAGVGDMGVVTMRLDVNCET